MPEYFESQYSILDEVEEKRGIANLGAMSSYTWNTDPKRLLFVLSRYKFAARMLEGSKNVIEIGCGDGFASRIVKQHVDKLTITDIDPAMIDHAKSLQSPDFPVKMYTHDFCNQKNTKITELYDGAYMLDVIEHIPKNKEHIFFTNLLQCLQPKSKVVVGLPSLESQPYASEGSKLGHINCKTKEGLYHDLIPFFSSVFCFSMNDEVVHTGFNRMSNYLFAVCTTYEKDK